MLILTLGCTQQAPPVNNTTACTEEAKICPDGSAVGRIGPNCEFAPCPQIVGNDTDAHGCKPSAGYSWCESSQKCYRPFEENCTTETLKFVKNPQLGDILTDGNGMTLYIYTKDEINKTNCYGKCAINWPPLNSTGLALGEGLTGKLGSVERVNSSTMATYNGMPLYYWISDKAPGDILGQGVGGVWFVVSPGMKFFPRALTAKEAMEMADITSCLSVGNLTNVSIYNNNTNTWWIDLDAVKPGCAPACVINENLSGEVNWRCTGLIPTTNPIVKTFQSPQHGEILTNSRGMSLYVYANDQKNSATCVGACASNWPPLILSTGYTMNVSGLAGTLGTVTRPDGLVQVTYNGIPLYAYVYDSKQGDVFGHGVNNIWYVVTTNMTTIPIPPPPPRGGGGGGGY